MKIVALAGGVGGAKLAHGLAQVLNPEDLTIVVNTGDDFEQYGLYISPDLDTVCYTLADLANQETGWGHKNESWLVMEHAVRLGGPDWFKLGDKDLGTHLERTRRLNNGQPLSKITRDFCKAWKVQHTILPMSDQPVRTIVETVGKEISFQEYFVHLKCEPKVIGFHFEGAERAEAAPGVVEAIDSAEAVVICPSNPWVSIDPILAVANLRSAVEAKLTIAVSPIIGGKAVKGPLAKMFTELGIQPSALAIIEHYQNLLNGFVLDNIDQDLTKMIGIPSITTDTLMDSLTKRAQLAQAMLHFMRRLL
ncbi:MAG: 2-phospho-L-lactate transferase [Anaerolineae bacterium]|nr:2-phospho-L-lactate transferase [Anaerolineae bacterium]MDK1080956.1 2-phospho-L-lactate transferase [Anaerolineae bacterium]